MTSLPPVFVTPFRCFVNIVRSNLLFVGVVPADSDSLFVIEYLHRIVDIITNYFGNCNDNTIKENLVTIYELLDETLDAGFPFATELNVLKEIIKPPNLLRTIANSVTGKTNVAESAPANQTSTVPWRKLGIKYNNNEAYFDVIEELDAILDRNGNVVTAEINGRIDCNVKLSGMPDLNLSFVNSRLFDDVSFHPCVRHKRWESERNLSFVPPDGTFRLMTYHIRTQNLVAMPIYLKQLISFKGTKFGKLELQIGQRRSGGRVLENLILVITMPKNVTSMSLTQSHGKYSYDPSSKVFEWDIGKLESKSASIKGTLSLNHSIPAPDLSPNITVKFIINQVSLSDVRVSRLDMFSEKYKPFKGVKYISKSGDFQIRT